MESMSMSRMCLVLAFILVLLPLSQARLRPTVYDAVIKPYVRQVQDWGSNLLNYETPKPFDPTHRLTEHPLNVGLPPYASKKGAMTVNGVGSNRAGQPDIKHTSGYFKLNRTHDARMFYFYFESRGDKAKDPLVVWMTGGPGCSSEVALFFENGPYVINSDNKTLSWSDYGWDMVSNIIYVDQPINTGFSYSDDPRDMRHDEDGMAQDMYEFLQEFLEAHPELKGRDFYITGESYGGHYVPSVGLRVQQGNQRKEGEHINIKGIAVGNGLTKPEIQYGSYPTFALSEKLITQKQFDAFTAAYTPCKLAARACGEKGIASCAVAFLVCSNFMDGVFSACGDGNLNLYDVREDCVQPGLCYDFSAADQFLNSPKVRKALGVGDRVWEGCNDPVYFAFMLDFPRNIEPRVVQLLEGGVRVLVYAGDKDYICNWIGNSWWVEAMQWAGKSEYGNSSWVPFNVEGEEKGTARVAEPLSFLRVFDSGHMVPMNQPKASLEMLRRFVSGEPVAEPDSSSLVAEI